MQLRRFTADSTPAALSAVRLAFGDDAVILANRRLGDQVEIIATGSDADSSSLSSYMAEQALQEDSIQDNTPVIDSGQTGHESIAELSREIASISVDAPAVSLQEPTGLHPDQVQLSTQSQRVAKDAAPVTDIDELKAVSNPLPSANETTVAMPDESPDTGSAVLGKQHSQAQLIDPPTSELYESQIKHSAVLESLRQTIEQQSVQFENRFKSLEVNLWGSQSANHSLHLRQLFALGIGAELAVRLVERADASASVDDALRQSFALLKSTLPIGSDKSLSIAGTTLVTGPSGSGKTTTLIKLATQYVKTSGNQSIVIIGADSHRIGAFEELQAYGKLLGVPTVQAQDTAELESLVTAFSHKQLILIDYALPENDQKMDLPLSLIPSQDSDAVRHLLVLPATMQAVTAEALLARHCSGKLIQCVLTHLDNSARLGELFNSIIRHHVPIAYWSDAQSVRIPLEKADASVLVATAVAMSRRVVPTPDDECLLRLVQPSHQLFSEPLLTDNIAQGQSL